MTKLFFMIGLPASGKSVKAKELAEKYDAKIHSSDELRIELFGNIQVQENNNELFEELHRRIKTDLLNGINVIYDATNLNSKRRRNFLKTLNKVNVYKEAIVMATPYNVCIERNKNRDRQVPEHVIERMIKSFNIPIKQEGFDAIELCYSEDWAKDRIFNDINDCDEFNQDNPFHSLMLGDHLATTCLYLLKECQSYELCFAGLYHDIGKLYTQIYTDSKGNKSDKAHYYNHENVSAYESLFLLKWVSSLTFTEILHTSALINYHMRLYSISTEKSKKKFISFIGEDMFGELSILFQADKNAH